MVQDSNKILFSLLRSAISGEKLTDKERNNYSGELLADLIKICSEHDVAHLFVLGLKQNDLISKEDEEDIGCCILGAIYRYEQLKYEHDNLCNALESAHIPFLPLKGSVIRKYYPEAWMRTSSDIDVLVHPEDLDKAISYLEKNLQYIEKERTPHDVSLLSPIGIQIELHFDLVEEGRANNAIDVLSSVWNNVSLHENNNYWYKMSDAFFYFYHIAHMAKHFENGGCGIRPFIDLWILDHVEDANHRERDELLIKGGLLKFANASRGLSRIWFGGETADDLSLRLQEFILSGGAFGSSANRVALQQKNNGGRIGYFLSRVFIPCSKLKRYYPILDKHCWLMPFMQIRRWFMLLKPNVARMAKREIIINSNIDKAKADEMNAFLDNIGLK